MADCAWCDRPIPPGRRRDARTCSQPCRQAWQRFTVRVRAGVALERDRGGRRVAPAGELEARRFGYADPPYPGLARRYYDCDEVDHVELVARLVRTYPGGWALSTSAEALRWVLALCPPRTRVCSWFRGARPARARAPLSAWEPLLICGGRPLAQRVDDVLVCNAVASRPRSHPGALVGMKPPTFAVWMFRLLGAEPGDSLDDLYPGSGAVGRAWRVFADASRAGTEDLDDASREAPTSTGDGLSAIDHRAAELAERAGCLFAGSLEIEG